MGRAVFPNAFHTWHRLTIRHTGRGRNLARGYETISKSTQGVGCRGESESYSVFDSTVTLLKFFLYVPIIRTLYHFRVFAFPAV